MIVIYPLLISRSVSRLPIPAIAKALENYIITYRLSNLIDHANKLQAIQRIGKYKIQGKKLVMKEQGGVPYQHQQQPGTKGKGKQKGDEDELSVKDIMAIRKDAKEARSATIKVGAYDFKTMSLEPTYITVDLTVGGVQTTRLVGVKVVPALVQSEEQLANLLIYDKQSGAIERQSLRIGRWITKKLYTLFAKMWSISTFRKYSRGTTTGDARKDILMNRTMFNAHDVEKGPKNSKANIFVCLSSNDLESDLFNEAGGVLRLFKMGWTSIVISDDVNKHVQFCMEEYSGHCVASSYSQLFNNFGSLKVFEDLEDARKTASALFKTKIPLKKLTGNLLAKSKLKKYRGR